MLLRFSTGRVIDLERVIHFDLGAKEMHIGSDGSYAMIKLTMTEDEAGEFDRWCRAETSKEHGLVHQLRKGRTDKQEG